MPFSKNNASGRKLNLKSEPLDFQSTTRPARFKNYSFNYDSNSAINFRLRKSHLKVMCCTPTISANDLFLPVALLEAIIDEFACHEKKHEMD